MAVLWLAIDPVLIRLGSHGNPFDWAHALGRTPGLFLGALAVSIINLLVVGMLLQRDGRSVPLAAGIWGVFLGGFGAGLLVAGHDSAGLVAIAAIVGTWLAYGPARAPNNEG